MWHFYYGIIKIYIRIITVRQKLSQRGFHIKLVPKHKVEIKALKFNMGEKMKKG